VLGLTKGGGDRDPTHWADQAPSPTPARASEYLFGTSTQIETAAPDLDWLNKGVFVGVGGRQPGGVIYEVYLVG
jgi:hypothetical protein